jgi:hypothetical protein
MKTKTVLVVGLAVVIGCAVVSVVVARRQAAQQAAAQAVKARSDQARNQAHPAVTPRVEPANPEPPASEPISLPPLKASGPSNARTQTGTAAAPLDQDPRFNDPAFKEQLGRYALDFVGNGDAEADEAWIQIINDPSLSADARQNLIEDLNEDGLSDPQNPSLNDLPLIESRLALIEELAPDAMDQVNADAFKEAYKDLVEMWVNLARG